MNSYQDKLSEILKGLPVIETQRLILRKLKITDAQDIYEYAKDPEISKYTVFDYHK